MNFYKKILLVASFSLFAIVFNASNLFAQKLDSKPADCKETPKVFGIVDVIKAEKNKLVDFTYTDAGNKVKFSDLTKGKVVFLNFWGTWCPPCRRELPDIVEIAKELKDKDFIVIGIALERDPSTAVKTVTDFATKQCLNYNLFIGNSDLQTAYGGISAVPTTFIIDKNGDIVETIVGMRDKAAFMKSINKVL